MQLNQIMKEFAESVGLKIENEFAHGLFNGYYISVFNTSHNKCAFINYANQNLISKLADEEQAAENADISDDIAKENAENEESALQEMNESDEESDDYDGNNAADDEKDTIGSFEFANEFQSLALKYEIKNQEIDENGISFETPASLVKFRELLESATELLKKYGYAGKTHCSSCGKPFSNDACRVYRDKYNYLVCADCADDLLEEQAREKERQLNEKSKCSKSRAITFSIIASFVLSVFMVILYKYILPAVPVWGNFQPGFIASLLPFAMAGANMMIYKYVAKKGGAERVITSLVIALVFTLFTQYACSVIQFVRSGARTLADAQRGVFPLSATQITNAKALILKTPLIHDTELYMFYKYLIVDIGALLMGIIGFSFSTVREMEKDLIVEKVDF